MADDPALPPGKQQYDQYVQQYGPEQADSWKAQSIGASLKAGRSAEQIDKYFGDAEPEHQGTDTLVQTNLLRFGPNTDPKTGIQKADPNSSPWDDYIHGFNSSALGETLQKWAVVGRANETGVFTRPAETQGGEGFLHDLGFQAGQMVGNLPYNIAGLAGGIVTGGPVGAFAGFGAAPTAARETIINSYGLPGGPKTAADWSKVVGTSAWKTAQSATTGLLGPVAGKLAELTPGPAVAKAFTTGATWLAGQTGLNFAMTGQVPDRDNLIASSVLMLAPGVVLHYAGQRSGGQATPEEQPNETPGQTVEREGGMADWRASGMRARQRANASPTPGRDVSTVTEAQRTLEHNLGDVYAKTGTHPNDVATRANTDTSYDQEIRGVDHNGDPITPQAREEARPSPPPFKPRPLTSVDEHRLQSQDINDQNVAAPPLARADILIPALEGGVDKYGRARISPTGAVGKWQIEPSSARHWGLRGSNAEITQQLEDPAVNEEVGQRGQAEGRKLYPNDTLAQLVFWNAGPKHANEFITQGPGTRLEAIPDRTVRGGIRYESVPAARNESKLPLETQHYLANGRRLAKGGSMPEPTGQPQEFPDPNLAPQEEAEASEEAQAEEAARQEALGIGKGMDTPLTEEWNNATPEMQDRIRSAVADEVGKPSETDTGAASAAQQDARVATERYLMYPDLLPREGPKPAEGGGSGNEPPKGTSAGAASPWENATEGEKFDAMRAQVGKPGKPSMIVDPAKSVNEAMTDWVSILWPAHLLDNDRIAAGDLDRMRQMGNEDWFRRVFGANDVYSAFEEDGRVDPYTGEIDRTNSTTKKMIVDKLKETGGNVENMFDTMLAMRTVNRAAQGIDTGFDLEWAKALVNDPKIMARYQEAIDLYQHFRDGVLNYALEAGLISQAQFNGMKVNDPVWVSMRRLQGDDASFDAKLANGDLTRMAKVIHAMEGSDGKIIDPALSGDDNARVMIRNSLINIARAKMVDTFERQPDLAAKYGFNVRKGEVAKDDEIDSALRKYGFTDAELPEAREAFGGIISQRLDSALGPTEFSYYKDGQRMVASIDDPLMAKLMKSAMGERDAIDMLQSLAAIQRAGIVLEPAFQAAFGTMHEMTAFIFDPNHPAPFITMARGILHVAGKSDLYREVRAAGGLSKSITDLDNTWNKGDLYNQLSKENVWNRVINTASDPQQFALTLLRALQAPSHFMTASRNVGMYATVKGRQGMEPGRAAMIGRKESVDYSERGARILAQKIASWSAFFHARLLITKQMMEGFEPQSAKYGLGTAVAGTMAATFAAVVMPMLLARVLNHEADKHRPLGQRYIDQPRVYRDTHLMAPVGDTFLSIKLPEMWSTVIGGAVNRTFDAAIEHDPNAFHGWLQDIAQNTIPNPIPTAVQAGGELLWAQMTPFGNPMIPGSLKQLTPDLQWTKDTTTTAKAISSALGLGTKAITGTPHTLSPILLDQATGLFLGPAGTDTLKLLGAPADITNNKFDWTSAPFIHSFFTRNPGMNSQVIQDYYDQSHGFLAQYNDIKFLAKRAEFGGEVNFGNIRLTEATSIGLLAQTNMALSVARHMADGINNNPHMTPDEKRQKIDTISAVAVGMAQTANKLMEATKKSERGRPVTIHDFQQQALHPGNSLQ